MQHALRAGPKQQRQCSRLLLAIHDVEGIRTDLSTARAEMSDAVAQYKRERQARRAARTTTPDLTRDREGFVARNGNKLTVAAVNI